MITFPQGFLWGASICAHQAEGGNFQNDWWRWEQRPARIRDGTTSEPAAGHYSRFKGDLDLAKKLGHNALLFSVEWSRVQPDQDIFDETAVQHYAEVVDTLVFHGIEPICVLHWATNPSWFAERYGWSHRDAPGLFERYVERIASMFAAKCRWWIPIYEPVYGLEMGYVERHWPPGSFNTRKLLRALKNRGRAHARAYRAIHAVRADVMVGVAIRGRIFNPLNGDSAWDLRTARRGDRWCNHLLLGALVSGRWPFPLGSAPDLKGSLDFVGLAFYGAETVRFHAGRPTRLFAERTDGEGRPTRFHQRQVCPDGLHRLLRGIARYQLPILITGNGIATDDDTERSRYLLDHLKVVHRCLQEGLDVRGYIHRSLLDGFEWTDGYLPRYGLVHVDRKTLARTPNGSAFLFKDICETGAIRPGVVSRFCPEWEVTKLEEVG